MTYNYIFPIKEKDYTYVRYHHDYPATDIITKKGNSFIAPISGIVDEVNRVDNYSWETNKGADRGGLFVSIIGDDGVRYYGSHLDSIPESIVPNKRVLIGELLGKIGNTGNAKGLKPHLHFGISWPTQPNMWQIRHGKVFPWKYLDAWKAGINLSPKSAVIRLKEKEDNIKSTQIRSVNKKLISNQKNPINKSKPIIPIKLEIPKTQIKQPQQSNTNKIINFIQLIKNLHKSK